MSKKNKAVVKEVVHTPTPELKGEATPYVNADESPLNPTHSGLMAKYYMDEFNKEEARLRDLKVPSTTMPTAERAGAEPSLNKYLKLYLQYADK